MNGSSATARAEGKSVDIERHRARGGSVSSITPIFSQLVIMSFPPGFKKVFENTAQGKTYVNESVLNGETVEQWSQMVTLGGFKGLSAIPNLTPQAFVERIISKWKLDCPSTFSTKTVGPAKFSGHDAFIVLIGCGTYQDRERMHSEAVLMIYIKGFSDYYTIQWAERGIPIGRPIELNDSKWSQRLRALTPIKICPLEAFPYPNCLKTDAQKG